MAEKKNKHEKTKVTEDTMIILGLIASYISEHGYAPSVRELLEMSRYSSTSTIQEHMELLFKEGYLETEAPKGSPRAFRLGKRAL